MKRLKILTSHDAHHRFLSECTADVFWLPRKCCPVKTPYSCGPTVAIRLHGDDYVLIAETSHRRFEVWKIDVDSIYNSEVEAEREQFAHVHTFGPVEHARFTGNPHRKCTGCDVITLDLDEN